MNPKALQKARQRLARQGKTAIAEAVTMGVYREQQRAKR